jgi:polyisoprenoid-binding protein YceI
LARFNVFWILILSALVAAEAQDRAAPQTQQSSITIKVFKSGLFSGFAHNHVVVAPIARAEVDPARLAARITVITKELKVKDPEVSDKDRAEIQSTMLGPKVLDQERYPEIQFKSSRIERSSPQRYRVTGMLELHGATRELSFEVSGGSPAGSGAGVARNGEVEHYHGATRLKQSDFGIKPISLFGGSVKVKDELELEFDVYVPAAAGKSGAAVTK